MSNTASFARGLGMDSTGQYVVACSPSGLYRSTNYGSSWSVAVNVNSPTSCWVSSDSAGKNVGMSINDNSYGYIMMSPNNALSWGTTFSNVRNTYAMTCNADGSVMVLVTNPGVIYVSSNTGSSFTAITSSNDNWSSVKLNTAGK